MAEQRSVRLTTALGDKLRFRRLAGEEALGRPFSFELELGSDDPAIELADLLGTGMAVEIDVLGGGPRHFHGLVSRFAFVGYEGDEAATRRRCDPGSGSCAAPPTAGSSRRRPCRRSCTRSSTSMPASRCTWKIG